MRRNLDKNYSRRSFLKVIFTSFWGLILASCKYPFQKIATLTPTQRISPSDTPTPSPQPTETPTETPKPESSEVIDIIAYGRLLELFGDTYYVPFEDLEVEKLLSSHYLLSGNEIENLLDQYQQTYGANQLFKGTFYPLPQVDSKGNILKVEPNSLRISLGKYDRLEIHGEQEVPIYELDEDEYAVNILLIPKVIPPKGTQKYSIHYYDLQLENQEDLYVDYEELEVFLIEDKLTIEILGYQTIDEFKSSTEEELEDLIKEKFSWEQEVLAYGYTELAFVFNRYEVVVPFVIDKKVNPNQKPSNNGGSSASGSTASSTPTVSVASVAPTTPG